MTLHFLNFTSALRSISESTKQASNYFTVLHLISNNYLNLYFRYTGALYRKSYNNIVSAKYDENDFTISKTEYVKDIFLKIKMPTINEDDLYELFCKGNHVKVGCVQKLDDYETYHLLQVKYHIELRLHDDNMKASYWDMLTEIDESQVNLILMNSNKRELIEFNQYENLYLDDLYFSSDEIENLISPLKQDRTSNLYTDKERDLANKLLVQFFADRLLKIKPELHSSKTKQSKIIALAMTDINRQLSERTIRDQLKESENK
jgi:hypothetical protein